MADKIKFGFLLAGGCAGCEMALVDTADKLVDALEHLEVVFWAPTVADVKYKDLAAMPDKSIDVAFVDGMIRNSEHVHIIKILREKTKVLVAFGACAALGGIPAMANAHTNQELFEQAYNHTFSTENPDGVMPTPEYTLDGKYDLTIPSLNKKVTRLQDLVEVEYFVGGCPPHHDFVASLVDALVAGNLPPAGSWLTSGKSVCDVCSRNPANNNEKRTQVGKSYRTVDGQPDPDKCLLQQGYICFGPVTQGDCGASCPKVNIPCRGCGGPMPGVKDFGARCLSAIASSLGDDDAADEFIAKFNDMGKLFYRYSYSSGILNKKL